MTGLVETLRDRHSRELHAEPRRAPHPPLHARVATPHPLRSLHDQATCRPGCSPVIAGDGRLRVAVWHAHCRTLSLAPRSQPVSLCRVALRQCGDVVAPPTVQRVCRSRPSCNSWKCTLRVPVQFAADRNLSHVGRQVGQVLAFTRPGKRPWGPGIPWPWRPEAPRPCRSARGLSR